MKPQKLNTIQLAWCRERIPAFGPAESDVIRRDADVERNRLFFTESRTAGTAPAYRQASHSGPAERSKRDDRETHA